MIYLDHNSTTPLDDRVVEAMQPFLSRYYGNPSALHRLGRLTRDALEHARSQVASLVGVQPNQVIFTSGGTEANNLALQGWCLAHPQGELAVSSIEHPSVLQTAEFLATRNVRVQWLDVDELGRVKPDSLDEWLQHCPFGLISCMMANNETGVIQPVGELVGMIDGQNIVFHTDAVQAAGRMELDFPALGVHLMSLSAHKIHGPKGTGALIMDRSLALEPLLYGGGQEWGLRGGTENVAGIVGFGKAAELAQIERATLVRDVLKLRQVLETGLEKIPGVTVIAKMVNRLPNTVQLAIPAMDGEMLVMALDREKIAVSSGSACASGKTGPSHVLTAMGMEPDLARGVIRVSLGKDNSVEDIERFLIALKNILGS